MYIIKKNLKDTFHTTLKSNLEMLLLETSFVIDRMTAFFQLSLTDVFFLLHPIFFTENAD